MVLLERLHFWNSMCVCKCLCVCACARVCVFSACGGQKRMSIPLELELLVVVSCLIEMLNSDPLEQQCMLLTAELALQHLF